MTDVQSQDDNLRHSVLVLYQYKYLILIVFFFTELTVFLGPKLIQKTYKSQSRVVVNFGREFIYQPEIGDFTPASPLRWEEVVNSEAEILTSRDLARDVIQELGPASVYPNLVQEISNHDYALEAAVNRLLRDVDVSAIRKSTVILIEFEHEDPAIAAQVVNLLVDKFKEKHLEIYSDPKPEFLEAQLKEYKERLNQAFAALKTFKQTHGIFDLAQQKTDLLSQEKEIEIALRDVDIELSVLTEKLTLYNVSERLTDASLPTDLGPGTYQSLLPNYLRLVELDVQLKKLLRTHKRESHSVQLIEEEKRTLKLFVDSSLNGIRSARIQEVENELSVVKNKRIQLTQQHNEVQQRLRKLDLHENALRRLERDVIDAEANTNTYAKKYEEAQIADSLNKEKEVNISVIEKAVPALRPSGISRNLRLLLGGVLGIMAGIALAFALELTRNTLSPMAEQSR